MKVSEQQRAAITARAGELLDFAVKYIKHDPTAPSGFERDELVQGFVDDLVQYLDQEDLQ